MDDPMRKPAPLTPEERLLILKHVFTAELNGDQGELPRLLALLLEEHARLLSYARASVAFDGARDRMAKELGYIDLNALTEPSERLDRATAALREHWPDEFWSIANSSDDIARSDATKSHTEPKDD